MGTGFWKLTWLEIKIFVREPLGVVGTVIVPAFIFVVIGRMVGPAMRRGDTGLPQVVSSDLPILTAVLISLSAVLSLVAIMAIYREGGILKRLRATPLRPATILTAHVVVKLFFTAITLLLMFLGGRRYYPIEPGVPIVSFFVGVLFSTVCVLSIGFLLASVVPTARFAQPVGALVLYPLIGVSGLFAPVNAMPAGLRIVARLEPFTYAVSLQRGLWRGDGWPAHAGDVLALLAIFLVLTVVSGKIFRWE